MAVAPKREAAPADLWAHQRELRDASKQLGRATRATVDDVALAARLQLERSPYLTLGSIFAAGYVLGGGVPVRVVRFALAMGMRMGASMAFRELAYAGSPCGAFCSARSPTEPATAGIAEPFRRIPRFALSAEHFLPAPRCVLDTRAGFARRSPPSHAARTGHRRRSELQDALGEVVRGEGFTLDRAVSLREAREQLERRSPDVVLLDLQLPDGRGFEVLAELTNHSPADVVVITGNASVDSAVEALRAGAVDYLVKPIDIARLTAILTNVARRSELHDEVNQLRRSLRDLGRFGPMIGASPAMQRLYDAIARVAPTQANVFIRGESGTGKELVAETVHSLSRRKKQKFVALNCGAISPQLIESELFGHERGSFTGADRLHRGYFERAHGGTIFFDEITEMPLELQVRLLRVLETRAITRVGAEQEIRTDVRVIAATNRDPDEAVAAGKLRQDLVYRLSVFPIELPALRDRAGDVELLAEGFLSKLNASEGTDKRFDSGALEILRPPLVGRGTCASSRTSSSAPTSSPITRSTVPRFLSRSMEPTPDVGSVTEAPAAAEASVVGSSVDAVRVGPGMSIEEAERKLILATLQACDGNKVRAAGMLKISLKTLYNRLNQYGAAAEAPPTEPGRERA
jgi:DNA-binding NtrC family response regulator